MNEPTTQVATTAPIQSPAIRKPETIFDLLSSEKMKTKLATIATKHATPDRMLSLALTYIRRVPKLAECSKESVMSAFLTVSQLGLTLDGRTCHLIPYKDQCTLVIDYKGMVQLMFRSGFVKDIHADVVYSNDRFEVLNGKVTHSYDIREDRGEPCGAYAIISLMTGGQQCTVMTAKEIESIRSRSKAGNNGPWVTDTMEMWKKCPLRRGAKTIPWSAEMEAALDADGDVIDIEARAEKPKLQLPVAQEGEI